jgi:predicted dehydrogenase
LAEAVRVGIIGAGKISSQYLKTFAELDGDGVRLVAVADLNESRARQVAESVEGMRALTVDGLIADPDVDAIVNLTIPAAHAEVALQAIAAGKAVYTEKPLAATVAEAAAVVKAADEAGIPLGCAPDTVLGTGIQTARRALDDGLIGTPIAATATMVTPGHERWHPDPDFYYLPGGGPLLDMGPYYVTSLVTLLGPVQRVIGAASALRTERTIQSGPRAGQTVPVSTPTHVTGVLVHASGALSTLLMSFDAVNTTAAPIEVHGTTGTLAVPDPNHFRGEVRVSTEPAGEWRALPTSAGYERAGRGYGIADMAWAANGSGGVVESRASGRLGFHVLEVMEGVLRAAETGDSVAITSTVERPAPVPLSDR